MTGLTTQSKTIALDRFSMAESLNRSALYMEAHPTRNPLYQQIAKVLSHEANEMVLLGLKEIERASSS